MPKRSAPALGDDAGDEKAGRRRARPFRRRQQHALENATAAGFELLSEAISLIADKFSLPPGDFDDYS